jgi:hypothetical protein
MESVAIIAGNQDVFRRHTARRADGENHPRSRACRRDCKPAGLEAQAEPIIERADFVGLEVAPGDVTELRRVDDLRNSCHCKQYQKVIHSCSPAE